MTGATKRRLEKTKTVLVHLSTQTVKVEPGEGKFHRFQMTKRVSNKPYTKKAAQKIYFDEKSGQPVP